MNNRRTRANSAPLNARVTLELANRLRQHLANQGYRSLSDFVTAAIEEKLARESLDNAEHTYWPTLNGRPATDLTSIDPETARARGARNQRPALTRGLT